jgi:hypothetical protein
MSKKLSRYDREQKSKSDKLQSRFNPTGDIDKPTEKVTEPKMNIDMIVYCPFCLCRARLIKFLTTDAKKQISTYRAKCRECNNTMLMRTLISMNQMNNDKIRSYARWVCEYRYGFWKKVQKEKWDKRLKLYRWAGTFWTEYRKVKATLKREHGDGEYD